jgi:hypothetical protein
MNSSDFIQRQRPPIFFRAGDGAARLLKMRGEIGNVNEIGAGGKGRARDYIFELADIPRPIVLQQGNLRAPR